MQLTVSMVSASWTTTDSYSATNKAQLIDHDTSSSSWPYAPIFQASDCATTAWVQLDFGTVQTLTRVVLWGQSDGRRSCSVRVLLSASCLFSGEEIVAFSCSDYSSCPNYPHDGFSINVGAFKVRCVRWQSSRSTVSTGVHFIEFAAYINEV